MGRDLASMLVEVGCCWDLVMLHRSADAVLWRLALLFGRRRR